MRNFDFKKNGVGKSSGNAFDNVKDELMAINPDDLFKNGSQLFDEIVYSIDNSVDNKHEHLPHLRDACVNVGALLKCLPIVLKNDKKGALLSNAELLFALPDINVKMIGAHAGVISEAIKMYVGMSDELVSNKDMAKQLFGFMGHIITSHDDSGVLQRLGRTFARTINDKLHLYSKLRSETDGSETPSTDVTTTEK